MKRVTGQSERIHNFVYKFVRPEIDCLLADILFNDWPLMGAASRILCTPNRRIAVFALAVFALDQFTKFLLLRTLGRGEEKVIIDGFFKFVHWGNTGAAWSLFRDNNELLAIVALVALLALFLSRHHFDSRTIWGQIAFGLVFGGIAGNLTDRLLPTRHQVIDFIRFYVNRGNGVEVGFPAFNVADSAICIGVGLVFLITWKSDGAQSYEGNNAK